MKKMLMLLLAAGMLAGCPAKETTVKDDETVDTTADTTGTTGSETTGETTPQTTDSAQAQTFGAVIAGADTVVVSQRDPEEGVDFGGEDKTVTDAEWIAGMLAAVGADTAAGDAVPRCMPNYTIVFKKGDEELASFGAVCGGTDALYLVRDGAAFTATDAEAGLALIRGLAK